MALTTWSEFTNGLDADDHAFITQYRDFCRSVDGVTEEVHRSAVQFKRTRIFTSAYVKSHYLEVQVDLLREAEHPRLRTAFASTRKVTTHRITLRYLEQWDEALESLIREAAENRRSRDALTVTPGTTARDPCVAR